MENKPNDGRKHVDMDNVPYNILKALKWQGMGQRMGVAIMMPRINMNERPFAFFGRTDI